MSVVHSHHSERNGYAMLIVLAFVALFSSLLAIACSQMSSSILTETARTRQLLRDQGSIHALARGLALLETGFPPSNPYACEVTIDTDTGSHPYTVTFALEAPGRWLVKAAPSTPDQQAEAMPLVFISQSPP